MKKEATLCGLSKDLDGMTSEMNPAARFHATEHVFNCRFVAGQAFQNPPITP